MSANKMPFGKRRKTNAESELIKIFIQELKNYMDSEKINANELCKRLFERGCCINPRTIQGYVGNDEVNTPSLSNAYFIAKELGFSLDNLLSRNIESMPSETDSSYPPEVKDDLWERYLSVSYWIASYFDNIEYRDGEEKQKIFIIETRKEFDEKFKKCNNDLKLLNEEISRMAHNQEIIVDGGDREDYEGYLY